MVLFVLRFLRREEVCVSCHFSVPICHSPFTIPADTFEKKRMGHLSLGIPIPFPFSMQSQGSQSQAKDHFYSRLQWSPTGVRHDSAFISLPICNTACWNALK